MSGISFYAANTRKYRLNYLQFLSTLDQWLNSEPRIDSAAIVGSYARQTAHPESDVDIAILTDSWQDFTTDLSWLEALFPSARETRVETWGPVKAVRFWLDELEIELNFSPLFWANVPVDPGTANVVAGGMTIMKDNLSRLQTLVTAVADGDIVNIRTHQPSDAQAIASIFHRAVHAIPDSIYDTEQKQAWSASIDVERWRERIETSRPFVAEYQDQLIGFIELDTTGYVDCFYVDPDRQQLGIGGQLLQQVLNEARGFGLTELTVDASLVAQPFFARRGFNVIRENNVQQQGVSLANVTMQFRI